MYLLTREAIWWLAKVKIWRRRPGSCVEVWTLEVNMHAWIHFRTMQCGRDQCALVSRWIRFGQFSYWTGLNTDSVWTGLKWLELSLHNSYKQKMSSDHEVNVVSYTQNPLWYILYHQCNYNYLGLIPFCSMNYQDVEKHIFVESRIKVPSFGKPFQTLIHVNFLWMKKSLNDIMHKDYN